MHKNLQEMKQLIEKMMEAKMAQVAVTWIISTCEQEAQLLKAKYKIGPENDLKQSPLAVALAAMAAGGTTFTGRPGRSGSMDEGQSPDDKGGEKVSAADSINASVEEILVPLTHDLLRVRQLQKVVQTFREKLMQHVKEVNKQWMTDLMMLELPDKQSQDLQKELRQEKKNAVYMRVATLDQLNFERYWKAMCSLCVFLLSKCAQLHRLIVAVVKAVGEQKEPYAMEVVSDSRQLTQSLCDLLHRWLVRIFHTRMQLHVKLPLPVFTNLFNYTLQIIEKCESHVGASCFPLRSELLVQSKAMIEEFHNTKIEALVKLMDQDNWSHAEVPSEFQQLVDALFQTASFNLQPTEAFRNGASSSAGANSKELFVSGENFKVASCALHFLKVVVEYMQLAEQLPSLSIDVLLKLVGLINRFNSRAKQLVLTAGAIGTAGLKSITSKHLALSSQSVGLVMKLIPTLKAILSQYIPAGHRSALLAQLDTAIRDLDDHRNEIFKKLTEIMRERFYLHRQQITVQLLETPTPPAQPPPSDFMKNLTKDIQSMHRALSLLLPPSEVAKIFQPFFNEIVEKLPQQILSLKHNRNAATNRVREDIKFLIRCLPKGEGLDNQVDQFSSTLNSFIDTNYPERVNPNAPPRHAPPPPPPSAARA
eukprot:GILI01015224.1.p1 GENE.GILI01015224.1~~GILI01015224.1.p1  ORF type:complete len:745 (+),score=193.26 GILI01015224.1:290-2236(+)